MIDWTSIINAELALLAPVVSSAALIFGPRMIRAFERRTGVQLTDQERAAVLGAAQTQAGIIETELRQGVIRLDQVSPSDPAIMAHAQAAIARVPDSAANQGAGGTALSADAMAAIIVGKVNTGPAPNPSLAPVGAPS